MMKKLIVLLEKEETPQPSHPPVLYTHFITVLFSLYLPRKHLLTNHTHWRNMAQRSGEIYAVMRVFSLSRRGSGYYFC